MHLLRHSNFCGPLHFDKWVYLSNNHMEAHLSDKVCICCCQKRQWLKPPGLMAYICWIVSFHIKLNHCQTLFQHTLPYQQVHLHRSLLTLSFQDPCYFYRQKACQTVHVSYSQAWSKEHGVPGLGRVPQTPASALTTSLHCLDKGWGPALMYMAEQYWCREDLSSARHPGVLSGA